MSKEITKTTVPKLRFPEFRESAGWAVLPLGDLIAGVSKRNRTNQIDRVFTNSAVSGIVDQRDFFDKDIATKGKTDNYSVIELGDYVYNPRISEFAPVGPTSKNKLGSGIVSPLYTVFRFHNRNNAFYEHYFKSPHWQKSLKAIGNSGARHDRMGISLTQLRLVEVPYPSLEEQQKIADSFSSFEEVLTVQGAKLEALQKHKQGLMQGLFPAEGEAVPRLRFPEFQHMGDWDKTLIGEKVTLLSGYPFKSSEISEDSNGTPLMRGINVTSGFIRHNEDIDRFFLGDTKKLEKFRLRIDDLVIGMDGSKVGRNAALITEVDSGSLLIQRVARLRAKSNTSIQFIFHQINSSKFHAYVERVNTSGGIPHISANQINDFEIYFPGLKEQQKIAQCLSYLDDLITAQSQQIEALKLHRKGLMQVLFPTITESNQ